MFRHFLLTFIKVLMLGGDLQKATSWLQASLHSHSVYVSQAETIIQEVHAALAGGQISRPLLLDEGRWWGGCMHVPSRVVSCCW